MVEALCDWRVAAASVLKQRMHSSHNLPSSYLKLDTVDTHYGQSATLPSPHLRGHVVAWV